MSIFLEICAVGLTISLASANIILPPTPTNFRIRSKRVVNGTDTAVSEFPYNVGVYIPQAPGSNESSECGGSIIGDRWVLTAAHCLYSPPAKRSNQQRVFLQTGRHYTEDYIREPNGTKFYEAEGFVIHPGYNDDSGVNDIALVRSNRKFQFKKGLVEKIEMDWNSCVASEMAIFSGWGCIAQDKDSQVLQKMQVRILPTADDDFCKYVFPTAALDSSNSTICAQGVNRSSICPGDSGGPLVAEGKLIGVALHTVGNDDIDFDVNYPNLFARVSSYAPWIQFHCKCIQGYEGVEYSKGAEPGRPWNLVEILAMFIIHIYF